METRQLRYFVAVAEERHFGRAALRLHMAQPPLSQQIRQLEEQLGTRLLARTTRRVDLTPAGELLLERARVILAEIDQLGQDVRLVGEGASGVIRVGFSGSATYRLMPRIVESARRGMPGLRLKVQGEMLTPQMEEALKEGRIDVAVLRPPVRSEGIELKFLEQDSLVVALPEDHPLAARETLELSDLSAEPFICYPQASAVNSIVVEACRKAGFRPDVAQEARETSTLLSFVSAGTGVALVPTTRRMFALQGIVFRPLRDAPVVDLAVAWNAGNTSTLVRNFLALFDPPASPEGSTS
ncbi:MAG: LysR substrate-binding domain-containing protein [Arthrobacter sp.]|uniref:LysR substrate-binding domain-containing protein n=1 Tax=Arthrobacter sp. TaxID=1667 RepID=UPI00348D1719